MKNKFKCPAALWRKMDDHKRRNYNLFMERTKIKNTAKFICPALKVKITDKEFAVIRHNLIIMAL